MLASVRFPVFFFRVCLPCFFLATPSMFSVSSHLLVSRAVVSIGGGGWGEAEERKGAKGV